LSENINSFYNFKGWLGGKIVKAEYTGREKKRTDNFTGILKYKD
jgi:hypothetical protein